MPTLSSYSSSRATSKRLLKFLIKEIQIFEVSADSLKYIFLLIICRTSQIDTSNLKMFAYLITLDEIHSNL